MKEICDEKISKPVRTALSGLGILLVAALGYSTYNNYSVTPDKSLRQGSELKQTKSYSAFSYLEQISEGGNIKEISQKNSLTDSTIIRFKLNPQGKVEEIVQNSSLCGKPNLKSAYPGDGKNIDWPAVNQTAQNYLAYFERN